MKIGDIKDMSTQMIPQRQGNENVGQAVDKQANGTFLPEEKVTLSAKAVDIQQIKSAVAKLPEIREEKVQELKSLIEEGAYNIKSAAIAEKMMGEGIIDIFA
ncbi:MAG TPA: flagellar biosynthesis anti-sigma factor FlgM [Syntrophales bacterium]|nr:flagellar biosynthesis anti-sigma factor FlgM [Syntrophales bacterium]